MASVDGLITGMSTTDTINQLMKIEAAPQTALKTKISTASKVVTAYQSVNTRMASLASAAKALGNPDTWGAMKATSSSTAAAVAAQAGASAGSISFRVDNLATTHTLTYATDPSRWVSSASDPAESVLTGSTLDVVLTDGTPKQLTPENGSLQAVVASINGEADLPYKAAAVQIGPGQYTLQLTAKGSGATATTAFLAAGPPAGLNIGDTTVTVEGLDAKLTVGGGTPGSTGYEIKSATNTFAGVMPGVTVTATAVTADPVTVNVATDPDSIAAKVNAMVENANVALAEIASQSRIKNGDVAAGPLVGDSAMRKLSQDILGAFSSGVPGLGGNGGIASFKDVGITVERNGKLAFDKDKFTDAFKKDPAKTEAYFTKYDHVDGGSATKFEPGHDTALGIGRKLEALALIASEGVINPLEPTKPKEGTLQALIQRRNDAIRGLNEQVSEWDVRLESRRSALKLQFSGLEVALGKMQQQSSWLAGQLAGLA